METYAFIEHYENGEYETLSDALHDEWISDNEA